MKHAKRTGFTSTKQVLTFMWDMINSIESR
jgi:hypothetical protein